MPKLHRVKQAYLLSFSKLQQGSDRFLAQIKQILDIRPAIQRLALVHRNCYMHALRQRKQLL